MQTFVWIIRFLLVVVLVWFAARNSDTVKLRGFLSDQSWEAPLVFVLLVVFVTGVVIGLLAWVPTVVRQRREIGRLRRASSSRAVPRSLTKISSARSSRPAFR